MTKQEEIEKVHGNGCHVVILGAGASLACTLLSPEKSGKKLPLMKNVIEVVGLTKIVDGLPDHIKAHKENFEKFYSEISKDGNLNSERQYIEEKVYEYFNSLDLPDTPTIYDYLILALRYRRDVIATFNWDPFLYKAYVRNGEFVKSPGILFLHGCVSIGFDKSNGTSGPAGWHSKASKQQFEPGRLLYPVEKKDYSSDPYIKGQWDALTDDLKSAERVTVFGYSAPVTDVEAIELLQQAWGSPEDRAMEQFELIDIRDEQEVRKSWDSFIHSHHYSYCTDYFKSSFAYHPRRTVESYHHWSMPMSPSESFQDGNSIPTEFRSLEELWNWHKPLIEAEEKFYGSSYSSMHKDLLKRIKESNNRP